MSRSAREARLEGDGKLSQDDECVTDRFARVPMFERGTSELRLVCRYREWDMALRTNNTPIEAVLCRVARVLSNVRVLVAHFTDVCRSITCRWRFASGISIQDVGRRSVLSLVLTKRRGVFCL